MDKQHALEEEGCFRKKAHSFARTKNMHRRDVSERMFHQFSIRTKEEACFERGGMLQRAFSSMSSKNRMRKMLWKRRNATKMIVINFEQELNKIDASENERCFKTNLHQFRIRTQW